MTMALVVVCLVVGLCSAQDPVTTDPETLRRVLEQDKALASQRPRVDEAIDLFSATWETWLAESAFKGEYTVVMTSDPTMSSGPLDQFREVTGPVFDRGRIVKLREWVRLETSPPDPLKEFLMEDGTAGYAQAVRIKR